MGAFGVWRPISVLLVVLLSQAPGVVLPFNVGLKLPLQTRASLSPVLGLREGPRTLGMPLPHRARSSVPVLAGLSAQQRSDESGHRGRRVAAAPQLAGLVIAGFLAGMIGAAPVDAAFGPGAAAVTSAPMVEFDSNKLENIDKMSAKKREQFRKALFGSQAKQAIDQLLQQLTDRIAANDRYDASAEGELDVLKAVVENMSPEQRRKAGALSELEQLRRKERDQMLEQQLKDRAELLDKLEHQPQWVSWAAAFFGSVTSTLIMHPIDTLKIRLIAKDGQDGEDDADGPFPPARTTPPALGLDDAPAAAALALSDPLGLDPLGLDPLGSALGEAASGVGQALDGAFSQGAGEGAEPAAAGVAVMARGSVTLDRAVAAPAAAAAAAGKGPESLLSLYDGILPNILKEAPSSALYLGIYELFRAFLSSHTALSPLPIYLLAGGMGEAVASIFRVPSETVKTRVQTGDDAMSALKAVFMDPKVRGNAVRSWSASLTRDVPMGAIQIALFEIIKTLILESPDIDFDISTLGAEALLGAFGGAVGAFVTTPSDVLTTRIITQSEGQEEGPVAMLKRLSDEGGPGALWVGALERTLYWAPAIGIFLSVYCSLRQTALQIM